MKRSVRAIHKEEIRKKWRPLSEKQHEEIMIVLRTCARLVLNSIKSEHRKTAAEGWMLQCLTGMNQSLKALPVPPSKFGNGAFSQVLTANNQLERQLYGDLDHIHLLQKELHLESMRLEQEQKAYEQMKHNLSSNQARSQNMRTKLHPLLKSSFTERSLNNDTIMDNKDASGLLSSKTTALETKAKTKYNKKLQPFSRTLHRHTGQTVQLSQKVQKAILLLQRLQQQMPVGQPQPERPS
ncbi:Sim4 and Mal2 associated protein 7 [Schizosaccharomyces cryophilus OY26]|uniref:Sim4 and Mal2 associated protein 7 n=1 Tax=Schizosaccharomyces cryophilus (strain OY26 / ATCC MYA-4695 / CBS 11777 / NBRC 106824 / NRRL Y48691) TaxID=653667 RepID=S9VV27_SCHCR|nr:Sim4 and Mal2 associated protein 7 [Schizosaccharomyces cryophilus OY26]EPY50054.1 Sim4 and Mal2 associated protein 7 [Schizosaccharomyces cryophilus OY26]